MKKISRPVFVVLLAIAAALLIAAASLLIISLTRDGGKTVDDALWNYEKGCMLYDSERIVKYSSDYRRYELAGNRESTRSALIETLDKSYSKSTSPYLHGKLEYFSSKLKYYDVGSDTYSSLIDEYAAFADTSDIERFADVTAVIAYNGTRVLKINATLVKISGRWFFFKNNI